MVSKINMYTHLRIAVLGNIGKIISDSSFAGTEIWTYDFCSYLSSLGYDVTLFSNSESFIPGCKLVHETSMDIMNRNNYLDYYYENIKQVLNFIERQNEFDIVHVSLFTYEILLSFIKYIRIPICVTVHSDYFSQNIFDQINKSNKNIHFCFVSDNQRKSVDCLRGSVIYNGIDCSKYEKFLIKEVKEKNYLFWIGRICPDKGTLDAIKIAQKAQIKLILAGPVEDKSYFDSCIKPYLNDQIKYEGVLDLKDKIFYYEHALATIMPIHWNEPFGLVNIESMYCGTPVISYNRGAQGEIIEHEKNGYLVQENNISDFISCIEKVKNIDPLYCHEYVLKNFSLQKMVSKYLEIYSKLLEIKSCEI